MFGKYLSKYAADILYVKWYTNHMFLQQNGRGAVSLTLKMLDPRVNVGLPEYGEGIKYKYKLKDV